MTMRGACDHLDIPLDQIEDIVAGCVNPAHEGLGDIARWAALAAGFPDSVPGATINRFCGSSVSATVNISHAIMVGDLNIGIAAGAESMSRFGWAWMTGDAPFAPRGLRGSYRRRCRVICISRLQLRSREVGWRDLLVVIRRTTAAPAAHTERRTHEAGGLAHLRHGL